MGLLGKPWSYYPLHTIPAPLDIVWCQFPIAESSSRPGPKARPALVRSIKLNKAQTKAAIEVTYGTSKGSTNERPLDLYIANHTDLTNCGLPQATFFVLDRTVTLPWSEEFFVLREDGSGPIIGQLSTDGRAQLEALKVMRRMPQKGR